MIWWVKSLFQGPDIPSGPKVAVASRTAYLLPLMAFFNKGKRITNVLTAVLFSPLSYLMFTKLLGVNLAPGILPF